MEGLQIAMLLLFILNVLLVYIVLKVSNTVDTNADILNEVIKGFDESQKQLQRILDHYNGTVDVLNSCITALDSTIDFCESLGCELQYEELDRDKLQEELDKFRSKIGVLYRDKEVGEDK
jgi:uncharacterized protein YoxC